MNQRFHWQAENEPLNLEVWQDRTSYLTCHRQNRLLKNRFRILESPNVLLSSSILSSLLSSSLLPNFHLTTAVNDSHPHGR